MLAITSKKRAPPGAREEYAVEFLDAYYAAG
jgi:hypothetical protein